MPYNTRHKSLSLHTLGIPVPVSQGKRAASQRTTLQPTVQTTTRSATITTLVHGISRKNPQSCDDIAQASKRAKRSLRHHSSQRNPGTGISTHHEFDSTPPPSPSKVNTTSMKHNADLDLSQAYSIGDDIVRLVMMRLHVTGNRPHHARELSAMLSPRLACLKQ